MECYDYQVSFCHNLIGLLIWSIKIGRIDIAFEVSALSIYLDFPITKHIVQALYILKYLEIHNDNDLAFDLCYQCVTSDQDIQSIVQGMKDLYVDDGEEFPPNAPKPIVNQFRSTVSSILIMQDIEKIGDLKWGLFYM